MSKHDFTPAEFSDRLARTRKAIAEAGLDWLILVHPVSIRWLIGQDNKSYTTFQCLPISATDSELVIFSRGMDVNEFLAESMVHDVRSYNGREPEDAMQAFSKFADDLGLKSKRVGMEVPGVYLSAPHYLALKSILGDALVAEPNGLIPSLKMTKSPKELDYHRKSAAIAGQAWQALIGSVAEGVSELALSGAAYNAILSAGSMLPASTMNLVTGERSCFALGGPTERQLKRGDTGLVELGGAYRRYTSTLGRQWNLGKPSSRLVEMFALVKEASAAAMAKMKAGVPAIEPHEALKAVFVKAGVDHLRQHTSGYGMAPGFPPSWGEPLNMFGGTNDVLKTGMVVTVEPALFSREDQLGARLIDNCIITESGVELLSTTPQNIVVVD
ncbi:Putative Xaa-Pro aminopeptidase [alpha proteobacterium BAL199]|jgi:Xaa-Pro dipeptidase|nr:Putative Xaa-Pro aminopeptidase [alpha proteobacterium BAL199]